MNFANNISKKNTSSFLIFCIYLLKISPLISLYINFKTFWTLYKVKIILFRKVIIVVKTTKAKLALLLQLYFQSESIMGALFWSPKTPNQTDIQGISIEIPLFRNHFTYTSLKTKVLI